MEDGFDAATRQIKGSIKEAIGMVIGDPVVEAEGAAEKSNGEAKRKARPTDDNTKDS